MKILGLDIETGASFTTPLEENFITEIGLVLWDTELRKPVKIYDQLISDGPESAEEAIEYTGITNEMRKQYGKPLNTVMFESLPFFDECDYVMAHNGESFDKPIVLQSIARVLQGGKDAPAFPKKIWIDSLIDRDYPKKYTGTNLTYLKGAKELVFPGHRAVFDVLAMLQINLDINSEDDIQSNEMKVLYNETIKTCVNDNLEKMIESASSPIVTVRACTRFEQKDLAKEAKFHWEADKKMWLKNMRKAKYEKTIFPFDTQVIG